MRAIQDRLARQLELIAEAATEGRVPEHVAFTAMRAAYAAGYCDSGRQTMEERARFAAAVAAEAGLELAAASKHPPL